VRWEVEHLVGPAATHHARELPDPARRIVWTVQIERSSLVLGSAQPEAVADADAVLAAGVDVVKRRSGGGAVLLEPGDCWVDFVIPRDDPLWVDDIGLAAGWVGDAWAGALRDLGVEGSPYRGRIARTRWSGLVCFAGLAPGEVTDDSRKIVGVSQRRTRAAARFQCLVHRHWDVLRLLRLLALDEDVRSEAARELEHVAAGVDRPAAEITDALLTNLP
jgi:lipoate-protein ligase A